MTNSSSNKPHVLILGGNFAGLGAAQSIRQYAGDSVNITVVDKKSYLLFIPNIPGDVFEGRDPATHQRMELIDTLARDHINFIQGKVISVDVDHNKVRLLPVERPGSEQQELRYDYLVVAVGNRLAFEKIEGFAEYGHTVTDIYHANRLREYLNTPAEEGGYKGGPIAIGSAKFNQGNGARGLEPYPGGQIPPALAACEGPPVEVMLSMATWLKEHNMGGPEKITVFTPAELIAEDAGEEVVGKLLEIASGMGFNYMNKVEDITRVTADGIEFANGQKLKAELKIIFPDWVPHDFMKGLPISDDQGFVVTDLLMRNPDYPNVFATGDAAAVTVPKLGAIGHQECDIVGRQIAKDVGAMSAEEADTPLQPVVLCIGDMGAGKAFYIHSNSWFGGDTQVLKMGRVPHFLKQEYRRMFFSRSGKMPYWSVDFAKFMAEEVPL